jgi:hypothetical protein
MRLKPVVNACEECGRPLGVPAWHGEFRRQALWEPEAVFYVRPDRRHCSNACRQRAYRKRRAKK